MVDSQAPDHLFTEFDRLRAGFLAAGARRAPMSLVPSQEQADLDPLRGLLSDFDTVLRSVIDLFHQFGPYIGFAGWLIQALYNRKVKQKLLIAQVIGLLRGWGLADSETTVLRKLAEQELIRLGLSQADAASGATQILEALVKELPPEQDAEDPAAVQQMLATIRKLVAYSPTWDFKEKDYGGRVKVLLPDNAERRVQVHVGRKDAAGRPLVEFVSVCGKVDPDSVKQVLRQNTALQFGAYTIRQGIGPEGDESAYFVLQHRVPLEEVNEGLLAKVLPYLASRSAALQAETLPRRRCRA
jgi:hypothetical protein